MTALARRAAPSGGRRLEELYEISKLFTAFDGIESTLDAALRVIAGALPLASAVLVESVIGGHTDVVAWPSVGGDHHQMEAAKLNAKAAYAYLVGVRSFPDADVRERLGPSELPAHASAPLSADRRFIVIPLAVGRGAVFGALQIEGAAQFDRADLEFVSQIASQLAIALDRNRAWRYDVFRRREAQLSQAKYETLVDHLDYAFVWEADATTRRVSYVSAQFEWMLGSARHECLDEPNWWAAHVHPDDREELEKTFARALIEAGNQRCDHRCIAADGGVRWLHTSICLVNGGSQNARFQGVSFDVTTARAAEERVRDQLSFASALASSLGEGTIATDLDDRITFINPAAAALLGCSETAAIGQLAESLAHLETPSGERVESARAAAVRTGTRTHSEVHRIVLANGHSFAATYNAAPIWRNGHVIGAVASFADISERRRAQASDHFLTDAGVALSASLDSIAVAGAVARIAVPVLGDLCFVDLVTADDRLSRVAWNHIDPVGQVELDHAMGRDPTGGRIVVSAVIRSVISGGRVVQIPATTDAWCVATGIPILRDTIRSALIVPLRLGERQIGALTFCTVGDRLYDEGDLSLAEALALRSALALEHARVYEQARHAVALREQTLEIASHDLRSPLATIVLASTLLGDDDGGGSGSKALAVEKIQIAAERMDRLIGDLLDFTSIEAGHLAITPQVQEIASIAAESLASFEAQAHKRQVTLHSEIPLELSPVRCDRHRVTQVLANLVSNALNACRPGDTIWLRAKQRDHDVVVSVADSGPGIARADQKHIFERYWRSPDVSYKGNGLGLAISRGIVDAHHGRIWVDSEPGHGATFSFTIPLAAPGRA